MDAKIEFTGIEEAKKLFGPVIEKAITSTVNKTASKTKTAASKRIRRTWNFKSYRGVTPASRVRRALEVRKAKFGEKESMILGRGRRMPLSAFGAKQKWRRRGGKRHRAGVVLRVKKKSPEKLIMKSIFLDSVRGNESNKHVMRRKGRARTPVDLLFGPSVPHMLGAKRTLETVEKVVDYNLKTIMQHELEFYIAREIKKVV